MYRVHKTCLVIARHVLWSQDMSRDNKICLMITSHVLIQRHVWWSQDMSCDHKTCLVITPHVLWSQDRSRDHKKCLVSTGHVFWSQDMSCDRKTCLVITRHVLWSRDTRHVLWSPDMFLAVEAGGLGGEALREAGRLGRPQAPQCGIFMGEHSKNLGNRLPDVLYPIYLWKVRTPNTLVGEKLFQVGSGQTLARLSCVNHSN